MGWTQNGGKMKTGKHVIVLLAVCLSGMVQAASDGDRAAGSAAAGNVFAEALEVGQELRAKREALERTITDPDITSPEIEAARQKVDGLTLRWSGKGTDEEKSEALKELSVAREALRELVFAHPDVKRVVADFEVHQARLRALNQQIMAIREAEKLKRVKADEGAAEAVKPE